MRKAELLSLPLTLLILVIAFGSLVAAGVPLLLAISCVMAALALVALPSQLSPVDSNVQSVILLIGLAVGVDYSLFYIRREREERAAGREPRDALEVTAATSGRAVLISGLTVIVAMAGMFLSGDKTFYLLRRGHDPRRRARDVRVADGAAGAARLARRPDRQGPNPVPRRGVKRPASPGSGPRSSTA